MKNEQRWSVRVQRQPHRDAVRRLRKAYERLWQMDHSGSVTVASEQQAEKAVHSVQEVSI